MPRSGRQHVAVPAVPIEGSRFKRDQGERPGSGKLAVDEDEGTWRVLESIDFARGVLPDLELPTDLLIGLATNADSGHHCSQADWDAVAAVLVDQLIDNLTQLKEQGGDFDGWPALDAALHSDMDRLTAFLGDEYDDRVITALATGTRGSS